MRSVARVSRPAAFRRISRVSGEPEGISRWLECPAEYIDRIGGMHDRHVIEMAESGRGHEFIFKIKHPRRPQRPLWMVDASAFELTVSSLREQPVAFGKEVFERSGFGRGKRIADRPSRPH